MRTSRVNSDWGSVDAVSGDDAQKLLTPVASADSGWEGLPMMVQALPGDAVAVNLTIHHPTLAIARSGRGKRRYTSGHHARDLYSSPEMFELYSADYCVEHAVWQGVPGEVIAIQFPSVMVNRLLHAEGSGFRLATRHELFETSLTAMAHLLWSEAQAGGPRGTLYAQGLTIALLGLLVEQHGACLKADTRSRARLSSLERSRVIEHIDQHLGDDLSVEGLAKLVQMSAAQFTRAFKASLGATPHAYVVERRIEMARQLLLADRGRSLAELADGLGFSSQSHFTEAFRRQVGLTPGRWRVS
jgi:AraC family transcriptional regulator